MRRSSGRQRPCLCLLLVLFALPLVQPAAAFASEDIVAIIVRFTAGEVTFPEDAYGNTAPIDAVTFRNERLQSTLIDSGVLTLDTVCAGWRHLEAPQYDVDHNEIPVDHMVDFTDVYRLGWNGSSPADQLAALLRSFREVVAVDLIVNAQTYFDPDPYYSTQWGLNNTAQTFPGIQCLADYDINAPEAWNILDSALVKVGLVDIGIDKDHEDLAASVDPLLFFGEDDGQEDISNCSPPWPHGSAVAGIVGAAGSNDLGVTGVASPRGGAILVAMRASATNNSCAVDPGLAANALSWASTTPIFPQIKILNISWGGYQTFNTVRDATRNAYLKGLFLAAASGNRDVSNAPCYPAAYPDYATAVGSILCDGSHPTEYVLGRYIDVVAPGGAVPPPTLPAVDHIVTTWGDDTNDQYWGVGGKCYFGGTSASAPHAAGVAALLLSMPTLANSLTNDDIDGVMKATAWDFDDVRGPDVTFGYGLIRADAALQLIAPPHVIQKSSTSQLNFSYVGTQTRKFTNIPCITLSPEVEEELTVEMYEMVGYAPFVQPALAVWTRGRQSNGWRSLQVLPVPNPGGVIDGLAHYNWAEVDTASVTPQGCWLRSYTCKFFRDGQFVGWYPVNGLTGNVACTPLSTPARLAYTYITEGDTPLAGAHPSMHVRVLGPSLASPVYRFSWVLPKGGESVAEILDVAGRRVRILQSGSTSSREVSMTWDGLDLSGRDAPAGIYFLRVRVGASVETRKVLVLGRGGPMR